MPHMGKSLSILALSLLMLAAQAQKPSQESKVFMTKTGTKYHRDGCRYLKKSKIEITLADAKKKHLQPCSVCKPPK